MFFVLVFFHNFKQYAMPLLLHHHRYETGLDKRKLYLICTAVFPDPDQPLQVLPGVYQAYLGSISGVFSDPDQSPEVLPGGSRPALPGTRARCRTRLHVSVHCQWHCNVHLEILVLWWW